MSQKWSENEHSLAHFHIPFLSVKFQVFKLHSVHPPPQHPLATMGHQKGATTKTQPGSGPKWTQNPSSKAAQSAAQDVMNDEDTCKQTTKTCHTSWTPARTETGLKRTL